MNPYGDGRTPGPNQGWGGQQQPAGDARGGRGYGGPQGGPQTPGHPGTPQGPGYPQPQPGYAQQPPQGYPPHQPTNGGGGGRKGVVIALAAAAVAVLAVAGAVALGLGLRGDPTSTASPVTFSADPATTTAAAPTTGAPTTGAPTTPPTSAIPQSDGFLTTTAPASTANVSVQLKLRAGGSGAGTVVLTGVRDTSLVPGATLPWEWQGTTTIGTTMAMIVTGTGPVTCSITVNGQEFSREGVNRVTCAVRRVSNP